MSINLGSAHGEIVIKSDKATRGAQDTIRALRTVETQAASGGKGFDRMARAGDQMGRSISRGAREAEQGIQMIARTAAAASEGMEQIGNNAGIAGGLLVAALGGAAKSAADLQQQIALISTIRPDINVGKVGDEIQAMSTRVAA